MGDAAMEEEQRQLDQKEHIFRSNYSSMPVPADVTLPEFVLSGAEQYADKVALVEAATGKSLTYGQVARETRRFAGALRSLGLRKGHVVVVALPNLALYPVVALGVMAAGGVFSGVNPLATPAEMRKQVEDSEAKLLVANDSTYEKVKDLGLPTITLGEERLPGAILWEDLLEASDRAGVCQSDLCALPYSSGTTGTSKGVMLTHRNLIANLCCSLFSVPAEMVGQATVLGLMPFFHIYGITGICCAALRNRGTIVVLQRFELRSFLCALIDYEVTFAPIVPPIMLAMVNSSVAGEFDLSRLKLRSVMSAAAPLAPELRAAFEEKFPGVEIQEAYGLTEHSCITLTHGDQRKGQRVAKKSSVGFILPNIEVKFIDPDSTQSLPKNSPGELCVRSQCVMQGYYKNKEETQRTVDGGGWLHTGDVGYIDDDGDIFIVDRIKELIKYKGFQVAPAELEAILLAHPSVDDAAVFGLPEEEAGEIPTAAIVKKADKAESEEEIMMYVAGKVASYKRVRAVHFVDTIPRSPSGKIMRRVLKKRFAETDK
ncbi:4-coumarate--CoA ligase-like 9 [Apostasia shenzhenica]|uniref:4-coumarate--CoA ligase n=1 Tax=Apostasia shenzhenica TaxID=1088818 RepID=A0A2I0AQR8_9ASPA|nr:4-coumarate--CoA ligase-like 9 [Apostasia shenzhenica]